MTDPIVSRAILSAAAPAAGERHPLSLARLSLLERLQSPLIFPNRALQLYDMAVVSYVLRQSIEVLAQASDETLERAILTHADSLTLEQAKADFDAALQQMADFRTVAPTGDDESGEA